MIEVRHLKLIDVVAKVGSLSKAAEELCLTQSALSHQLKELESRLGVEVFHRVNSQLHFTPEGKELRDAGSKILDQFEKLERRVQEINQDQLKRYVHGYSDEESSRLKDQAETIAGLLHHDSSWDPDSLVLEVGCGVGAQTRIISTMNPEVRFVSVDISEKSLAQAKETIESLGISNVEFKQADVFNLPFENDSFDHVFICFVLEHLDQPEKALQEIRRVTKTGGTLTVIEGDHGSTYFYPETQAARKTILAQVELQKQGGGNANIGRQLFPILTDAGFSDVKVDPRQVYVDQSMPEQMEMFVRKTFAAMVEGIKEELISQKHISQAELEQGIQDILKTTQGGSFCYTFFKAIANV